MNEKRQAGRGREKKKRIKPSQHKWNGSTEKKERRRRKMRNENRKERKEQVRHHPLD